MTGSILFGWVSLVAAVIGLILFFRRIILWQMRKTSAPVTPLESTPVSALTPEHRVLVISDGAQSGPYTRAEIVSMYQAGRFTIDAMCWEPGQTDWKPVKTLVLEITTG